MDRYPYLEYTILLDERILVRLRKFSLLIAYPQKHNYVNAYQVFGVVARENFYFIVVFILISTLSTSLVLRTFVLI